MWHHKKQRITGEQPRRLARALVAVAAMVIFASIHPSEVRADGTETLGPAIISIASGTGVIIAGTGLSLAQPDTIDINVPAGSTVEQVLLYWEGRDFSNGDDTIVVNGTTTVTGSLIGGPLLWATPDGSTSFGDSYTYRADITDLNLVDDGPSANIISVEGLTFDVVNNGAGVVVIVDDGLFGSLIGIRDGNDLVNDGLFKLFGPLSFNSVAQTFTFPSSGEERMGTLSMHVSAVAGSASGGGFRPTAIDITVGGVTVTHNNVLDSVSGEEWDALDLPVTIPAGETMVTVQIFSDDRLGTGGNPASLTWNTAALSIEDVECIIEVDKTCVVLSQPASGNDCQDKVIKAVFEFTGDDCADPLANSQSGNATCSGSPGNLPVDITVTGKGADKVLVNSSIVNAVGTQVSFTHEDGTLKADTRFDVGGQSLEIHTSCSKPLNVGDLFGSMLLVELTSTEGGTVTLSEPVPAKECEVIGAQPGSCADGKPKSLVFQYTGDSCEEGINSQTKDSCSGDPMDGQPVSIVATGKDAGKVTISPSNNINVGDLVTITATGDRLRSSTKLDVVGGAETQSLNIHTSCSDTLVVGDQFGSLLLQEFIPEGASLADGNVNYIYQISHSSLGDVVVNVNDDQLGEIESGLVIPEGVTVELTEMAFLSETTTNTVTVTDTNAVCTTDTDTVTVTVVEPPPPPFVCSDAKPITSLTLIWNGPGVVNIVTEGGEAINGISNGDEVTISTAGLGNDVDLAIAGAVSGDSRFHVSCSDQEMNGPEDCGSAQGNGKDNNASRINDWLFEGMAGDLTLDCNP